MKSNKLLIMIILIVSINSFASKDGGGGETIRSSAEYVRALIEEEITNIRDYGGFLTDFRGKYNDYAKNLYSRHGFVMIDSQMDDLVLINKNHFQERYRSRAISWLQGLDDQEMIDGRYPRDFMAFRDEILNEYGEENGLRGLELIYQSQDIERTFVFNHVPTIALSVDFYIAEDSPCILESGEERPGSFSITEEGEATVCISQFLLQQLPPMGIKFEIQILLAHEMAHLIGYTQEENLRLEEIYKSYRAYFENNLWDSFNKARFFFEASNDAVNMINALTLDYNSVRYYARASSNLLSFNNMLSFVNPAHNEGSPISYLDIFTDEFNRNFRAGESWYMFEDRSVAIVHSNSLLEEFGTTIEEITRISNNNDDNRTFDQRAYLRFTNQAIRLLKRSNFSCEDINNLLISAKNTFNELYQGLPNFRPVSDTELHLLLCRELEERY